MKNKLTILPIDLLETYLTQSLIDLDSRFNALKEAEISTETFSFYISVSSVCSSKTEGEQIELDSYMKYKKVGVPFLPNYTRKIDDLYDAYQFAFNSIPNEEKVSEAHKLLAKNLVAKKWQGKYRNQNMYVTSNDGKIEYVAASSFNMKSEMNKLFKDIEYLLNIDLKIDEVFYFAALIHLVFVKIHPWNDSNGRTARLLEKWFLAKKLGEKAWYVHSEKKYYEKHHLYHSNIRSISLEYEELKYENALPFLQMLPNSI